MTPLGDVATLGIRGPAESFGEMALVHPESRRAATVPALEPAETRALACSQFEQKRGTVELTRCRVTAVDAEAISRRARIVA
jgi:CRP-like cAMP-binding protein